MIHYKFLLYDVTIATRGKASDSFGDKVKRIFLERTKEESVREALSGTHYDVVIDKIAYCSNDIKYVMDVIDCDKYIYMSSTSVYNPKHINTVEADFDGIENELIVPPSFTAEEKVYYTALRQGHKLFEKKYLDYSKMLNEKFKESDKYYYDKRTTIEKILGYYNVGTDLCNGEFCGNTIICALHTPIKTIGNEQVGNMIKGMSVIAGKLSAYLVCTENLPYKYNDCLNVTYKDFHFYKDCPLKLRTSLGFELFTILCIVNYVTVFIEKYFIEEIPQKFKFAYLQYYYLCDFIKEFSVANNIGIGLNSSFKNRGIRNCLAHYGLGQFLSEDDVIEDDVLKGLCRFFCIISYNRIKRWLIRAKRVSLSFDFCNSSFPSIMLSSVRHKLEVR